MFERIYAPKRDHSDTAQVNQHVVRRWVIVPTDHRFKRYLFTCSPLVSCDCDRTRICRVVLLISRGHVFMWPGSCAGAKESETESWPTDMARQAWPAESAVSAFRPPSVLM